MDLKLIYNQKANELIQQIIIDDSYSCLFAIGDVSIMIEQALQDAPNRDIKKMIIEKLNLRDNKELDSLRKISNDFILDSEFVKKRKLKIVNLSKKEQLSDINGYLKMCPNGALNIFKPIFDKEFKTALIYDYDMATLSIYKYENGKWKRSE